MEKKEYWFALYPDSFLWLQGTQGLVYNAGTGAKIRFVNEGAIANVTATLLEMDALYCTLLSDELLEDTSLKDWIQEICKKECGILVINDGVNTRPLSLPPILKVQDGVDFYKWEHTQGIDGNIIENLHRLVFYLNGSEWGNNAYSKQFLYPVEQGGVLSQEAIRRFANNSRLSPFLSEIGLVGNPFAVEKLDELIEFLQTICPVRVYCTWQDVLSSPEEAGRLAEKVELNIAVTGSAVPEGLPRNATFTFPVTSEEEYERALESEEKQKLEKVVILPVYTGNNLSFFEKNLYMDEEELQDIWLTKKDIFIRQTLNIHDFGKLLVMPDGKIYANPNHASIGKIDESPYTVVYRELTEGHSWLRTRKTTPCCDCVYQWLCPSPSNYEVVVDKPNFCYIKP